MKIGTDSVLLGAAASVPATGSVLDVGAGTGVLSLMVAQRCGAVVDAIEIHEDHWRECRANISSSPWKDRIRTFHTSFRDFKPNLRYDLIISNPPYFSDSQLSGDEKRNLARHQQQLKTEEFLNGCKTLLLPSGRLSLILPTEKAILFQQQAERSGLNCIRLISIIGRTGKSEKRRIMEFAFENLPLARETLVIEHNGRHDYTKDYLDLVRDFLFLE